MKPFPAALAAVLTPLRSNAARVPCLALLLSWATLFAPASAWAQESPPPPVLADTLRAVEMAQATRHGSSPNYDGIDSVVATHYPPALKAAGVGGTVLVRLVVDAHGRALAPRVAESGKNAELDTAALRVAREIRFRPAIHDGAPHPVWAFFTVRFRPPGRDWVEGVTAGQVRAWADSAQAAAPSQVDRVATSPTGMGRLVERAYPPALRDAGVRGVAVVWMVVGSRGGAPSAIRLALSTGHAELDRAALQVADSLRFTPAVRGGQPVSSWVAYHIQFLPRAFIASNLLPPPEESYELSPVEEQPELRNRGDIAKELQRLYTPELRQQGIRGQVTLAMSIDTRGVPTRVQVVQTPHPELGPIAVRIAEQMRFRPARTAGRPVEVRVTIPLTFTP